MPDFPDWLERALYGAALPDPRAGYEYQDVSRFETYQVETTDATGTHYTHLWVDRSTGAQLPYNGAADGEDPPCGD